MPYVIADACVESCAKSCVDVCPVDCIYEGSRRLWIHPEECVDCGACEPECPWQAIFEEPAVPEIFQDDIALNHATVDPDLNSQFTVALFEKKEHPTAEQVAANKLKWGMDSSG